MKVSKKTLEALNKSIEHWTRMATGNEQNGEEPGVKDCALCHLYRERENPNPHATDRYCFGCPIKRKTGRANCVDTPYYEAYQAWSKGTERDFRPRALVMRDWLIELRKECHT